MIDKTGYEKIEPRFCWIVNGAGELYTPSKKLGYDFENILAQLTHIASEYCISVKRCDEQYLA